MANKTFGALTEEATVAAADLFAKENAAGNSRKIAASDLANGLKILGLRGALTTKAANQTTANYTTTTEITFDSDVYDTDSIHDTVTNNNRLTVPAGVTYVRVSYGVSIGSITADVYANAVIRKNGTQGFAGNASKNVETGQSAAYLGGTTAIIPVTPGDYFTLALIIETDTSVTINADQTWFAMEIVA